MRCSRKRTVLRQRRARGKGQGQRGRTTLLLAMHVSSTSPRAAIRRLPPRMLAADCMLPCASPKSINAIDAWRQQFVTYKGERYSCYNALVKDDCLQERISAVTKQPSRRWDLVPAAAGGFERGIHHLQPA